MAMTVTDVHWKELLLIFQTAMIPIIGALTTMLMALGRNCWIW